VAFWTLAPVLGVVAGLALADADTLGLGRAAGMAPVMREYCSENKQMRHSATPRCGVQQATAALRGASRPARTRGISEKGVSASWPR
jgi:hypothetical protein